MPIHLEDRKTVKKLLAGDERAFNRFFDDHFSRLYRFALARTGRDREASREIVQTTLSRALRKLHSYRGESALFTWLCVICRNECIDWQRRNARYRETIVLTEDLPQIREVVDSFLAQPADGPEQKLQRHEAGRLIQVALDGLPARYGDALEWKYIQGLSVREIAGRLNISTEAAQSLLARARRAFQEIYSTLTEPLTKGGTIQEAQS